MSYINIKPKCLGYYVNTKPILGLKANNIWAHIEHSSLYPNIGTISDGALIFCWTEDGNCQNDWCGGTFILPGQYAKMSEFFVKSNKKGKLPSMRVMDNFDTSVTLPNGRKIKLKLEQFVKLLEWDSYND